MENQKNYSQIVFLNDEIKNDPQKMEWVKSLEKTLQQECETRSFIQVIYTPSCGCNYEHGVFLDRWLMSEKITTRCENCKKGIFMEISNPIRFYIEVIDQEFGIDDFSENQLIEISEIQRNKLWRM